MKPHIIPRYLPVQCYGQRHMTYAPKSLRVQGITQHYFSGEYAFPADRFNLDKCWQLMHDLNFEEEGRLFDVYPTGPRASVSAHFMIGREGEILQLVPLLFQAWHAGTSEWNGKKHCNQYMVGIENIGAYNVPYTDAQYKSNAYLCALLMDEYHIDDSMIVGHEDVAPGRKKDPGPTFEWLRLRNAIKQLQHLH